MINKSFSRRDFMQLGSMGLLGAALPLNGIVGSGQTKWRPAKLSVQLYSVRDQIKADIPGTLKRVKDIGFDYVETAFWPDGISIQQAAKYLKEAGLSVS